MYLCVIKSVTAREQLKQILERTRPEQMRRFHEQMGESIRMRIRAWVERQNRWVPLAPTTVAAKQIALLPPLPLVSQTNALLRSLYDPSSPYHVFHANKDGLVIGTSHPLARYHHEGTRPYEIHAKQGKPLRFVRADGTVAFAMRVFHPGLPARPLFPPELSEQQAEIIANALRNHLMGERA